jgi:type III pantothenate kinase
VNTLLVVDIGNTTTKVGAWNGTTVEAVSVTPTRETESLLESLLLDSPGPRSLGEGGSTLRPSDSSVAICSVVPQAEAAWLQWCERNGRAPFIVRGDTPTPLVNRYRAPDRLGPDRLAAAVGAAHRFGAPAIVASLGTAVVVDAVSPSKEFLGGAIWVGMAAGFATLAERTGLPDLAPPPAADGRRNLRDLRMIQGPSAPIGDDTQACLLAGAFHGTAALIDGLAQRMRAYMDGAAPLVLTGGDAEAITFFLREKHEVVPHLALIGSALIWEHNHGGAVDANR